MKNILFSALFLGAFFSSELVFSQTDTSGKETYRETHTKTTELKHTKLKVNFDYQKEQMNGEEWLTASPNFYATDSLVLDAKGMLIHEVSLDNNGKKSTLKYEYKDDLLKINLGNSYSKNQDYTVYIKYTARPNEVKQAGSAAITDAKGLYFINPQGKDPDKPTQIWTQGETESSSAWFPTIDKPNQKSTEEIYMTVPDKYVTLSNGILKDSNKEANGMRTDHWMMEKRHSVYLFFMGVGDFAIVKDKWKNMPVDYYVEKEYEPFAKQIFGNTPEMIDFYSKTLNYDFPWAKYAQMVGRDYVSGAMENTTATLHGEAANQKAGDLIDENKWEDVIAHELFHQWFGDLVTAESWSNITVNESFANYSEYLWEEHKYGKDAADFHLMNEINGYKADPSNFAKNLVRFNYTTREDVFDGVSYNKGGAILHMLRNYLGDEAFFAGLNDYLKTNEYKNGEAQQLRLSLEKVSGKDLNWFFNQWYYGNGNPKLDVAYSDDAAKKQITVSINQTQSPLFQFPLAIDVYSSGKPTRYHVWAKANTKNEFIFSYNQKPDLVNVNADQVLLADINDKEKTLEHYLFQYKNAKEYKSRFLALQAAKESVGKGDVAAKIIIAALNDPFYRLRMEALKSLDLSKPEQATSYLVIVEKLATSDSKTLVQAAAIGALAKLKDKKYSPIFEKGMNAVSNSVKANSLAGLAEIDPNKVATLAEKMDLSNSSDDLMSTLLPIIVKNKIASQMPAIAKTAAFYPFIKFQNPSLGASAEEAFNWIMTSDNLKATQNVAKVLSQVKGQIASNPQAKMMLSQVIKDGITKKTELQKANPSNMNVNQQIEVLNKVLEEYK